MYGIIVDKLKKLKTEKKKEKLNYYAWFYFYYNNETYNADGVYARLSEKNKIKIDIFKCENLEEEMEIFDKRFVPFLNSRKIFCDFGNLVYILYLSNLLRKESVTSKKIQIELNIKIMSILIEKELGINDIEFLSQIVYIFNLYYSLNLEIDNFPLSLKTIKKIVYKLLEDIKQYEEILDDHIIEYNERICLGLRCLLSIDKNESNFKEYLDKLNNFIENNKVEEYTKFIFNFSKIQKNNDNNENISIFIKQIKKIVNGETNGNILQLIYMCCLNLKDKNKLIEFYKKIKEIQVNNTDVSIKYSMILGENILKFWSGNKIDLSFLKKGMIVSNFFRIIVLLDNKEITYNEFIEQLKKIKYLEIYSIFDWNRLDLIFKNYDLEWLQIVLEKIDVEEITNEFKTYLLNIYVSLLNNKRHMFLKKFLEFNDIVILKNNDIVFKIYSVICMLYIYNFYNADVKKIIDNILNDIKVINIENSTLEKFLMLTIIYISKNNDTINIIKIKKIINSLTNINKRNLFLLGLYYIDNSKIDMNTYLVFLEVIFQMYNGEFEIDDVEFSMINHLANKIIVEKKYISTIKQDTIYFENDKFFVLEEDYMNKYEKIYNKLNIKKIESISSHAKKNSLLCLIISRLYFSNIEKFNAGKMIKIPSNLTGKELMLELLKELGYEDSQKNINRIKQGETIDSLWLNEFSIHQFMKDVKSKKDNKFIKSVNGLNISGKKIIHITSLVLLAKLKIIDKLINSENYYCTGYVFQEISKMKANGVYYMIDGVVEEAVNYEEYIIDMDNILKQLNQKKQIEYVSNANILGIREIDKFNGYDKEFLKLLSTYDSNNLFTIITEDPFYFKENLFKKISYGTYSLIIDMFCNSIITGDEFLNITISLENLNYNLKIGIDAYNYILSKSDNPSVAKIIEILNKYN